MNTVTYTPPALPERAGRATPAQIDQFYDWIYQRGVERLAARGVTPQMLWEGTNDC